MTKRELNNAEKQELLTDRFTAPFKGKTVGHVELTEEDKSKSEEFLNEKIKEFFENKNKDTKH